MWAGKPQRSSSGRCCSGGWTGRLCPKFPETCSADSSWRTSYPVERTLRSDDRWRTGGGQVDSKSLTSVLKLAAVCRNSSQSSCIPSVSQVEFSRQEKNPQPTVTAPLKHLATSAANTQTCFTLDSQSFPDDWPIKQSHMGQMWLEYDANKWKENMTWIEKGDA